VDAVHPDLAQAGHFKAKFFDPAKPADLKKLVDKDTAACNLESLGNPKNDVPDFAEIAVWPTSWACR
jgi:O-acetylhomoserine/O-acetylserine sulfhydrylase-like pyridoxal-dependent enzyme